MALANEEPSSVLFPVEDASTEKKRGAVEIKSEIVIKAAAEDNIREGMD